MDPTGQRPGRWCYGPTFGVTALRIALVALVALVGCSSAGRVSTTSTTQRQPLTTATLSPSTAASSTVPSTTSAPPADGDSIPIPADALGPLRLVEVVDGDTVRVEMDGGPVSVRLIGIDTPEVRDPRKPVQCFGREASNHAHDLLDGRSVFLSFDPSQGPTDKYGRALGYLWRDDGLFVNLAQIADGFAHEYTYDLPYAFQDAFRAAERSARTQELGLWSASTCAGDTTQPADGADSPSSTVASSPGSADGSGVYYADCAAARAAGAAPLHRGDPGYRAAMDGDGDGVACE